MTASDDPLSTLRTRLTEARAHLLEAVTGLTERDFAAPLDGAPNAAGEPETVVGLLASLVAAEYEAVRRARAAVPTLDARPVRTAAGEPPSRILPPQVVHGLAGARHETGLLLAAIESIANLPDTLDSPLEGADDQPETTVRSLLEAIARREDEAAQRIRARPGR
ncbi:MAG: hypothetical protein R3C39_03265 [Dehalococcoidia bacterium]